MVKPNDQNPYAPPDAKRKSPVAPEKIDSNNPEDILRHKKLTALHNVRHLADELQDKFLEEEEKSNYVFRNAMAIVAAVLVFVVFIYVFS